MDEAEKVRKTVSFTHRQMGIGAGGVLAAIMALGPVKDFFYTREEGKAVSKQVEEVKANQIMHVADLKREQERNFTDLKLFITGVQEEQTRKLERLADKLVDRQKESEARMAKDNERQDHRMDSFENYLKLRPTRSSN